MNVSDAGSTKRTWNFNEKVLFAGDYVLEIKHDAKVGTNMVGGFNFNTAFVPKNEYF